MSGSSWVVQLISLVLWLVIWSVNTPFKVILVPYYTLHLVTVSFWSLNFWGTGSHLGKSRPFGLSTPRSLYCREEPEGVHACSSVFSAHHVISISNFRPVSFLVCIL